MIEDERWQAEQLPYPCDADYEGAMAGLFDLHNDADRIVGTLNAGDVFVYMFRRFGYPRFGWDEYKELVVYRITTPMVGVVLTVRPNVTGAHTFGYMLQDDIQQQCEKEERKPYQERYERFEAWALREKGIETIHLFLEPDREKLTRVWSAWVTVNKAKEFKSRNDAEQTFYNEQAEVTETLLKEYLKIEPYPEQTSLKDRSDDSIMKQCHTALCDAIRDMLRPVYVRDVMINISGEVVGDVTLNQDADSIEYSVMAGHGIGNICRNVGGFAGEDTT